MNKKKYLDRIKYKGLLEPNLDLLKQLQRSHLLNILFENLDIHYNTAIELNINQIFEKVILNNRGGFCYELNGLFFELLCTLGFNAKRVSARVFDSDKGYGPEFDHMSIIVKIENTEYLTDVGFGEFAFEPLELKIGKIQNDERGTFVINNYEEQYLRVNKVEDGLSTPEYIFSVQERNFSEYEKMCHYHQSDPRSHFTRKLLISRPTKSGRITISGNMIKVQENNTTVEKEIKDDSDFAKVLWDNFSIRLKMPSAENG